MLNLTRTRQLVLTVALCLAPGVGVAAGGSGSNKDKRAEKVDVIMVYKARPDRAEKDRLRGLGAEVRREFNHLNMRVVSIPEQALSNLGRGKGVRFVAPDRDIFSLAAPSHAAAHVPALGTPNAQFDGSGVAIAVVDSGIGLHDDLPGVERIHMIRPETALVQGTRHDSAAQAMFVFDEGNGTRLFDRSGSTSPLDLDAESTSGLSWQNGALTIGSATRLSSETGADGVFKACTSSNAISVEAWVRPANTSQGGPARIVTFSHDAYERNFTLAQDGGRYVFRLRTTTNGHNGMNTILASDWSSVTTTLQHVMAVRDAAGNASLYLDGALVDSAFIGGNFSNWNAGYSFGLGNEFSAAPTSPSRGWVGDMQLAAVHCGALSAAEVADHYAAGSAALESRQDPLGHGTHVAGILGGNGQASGNAHRGAARGAALYSLRVLDGEGRGKASDALAAMDWLLGNGVAHGIQVVNLSIGKAVEESNTTDPLVLAVEQVWDAGMVVVVAAGNHGRDGNMTITSPANSRKVITVGSLTDNGTGANFDDDYVSTFSSMGPTLGDHVLKPDLVAPGNRVVSAIPAGTKLAGDLPQRIVPCTANDCTDGYFELSGTSMAAPLVSAAAAAMLDKEPGLSPATVKARLMRSARKINAEPTAAGAGVLDVEAALSETGFVTGEALSPLMGRTAEGPAIHVEDTSLLWGDDYWGAGFLWTEGYLWSDEYLTSQGYLWTDGNTWANGFLWTDGDTWANGYLWSDEGMWANGFLWSDEVAGNQPLYDLSGQTILLNDD